MNVSLVTDLPLFIDPFLLFNSRKRIYRGLHDEIIRYLGFLRDKAQGGAIDPALLAAWYKFSEVKQTWLGFTKSGNQGTGLGDDFANALHENLHKIFSSFGKEKITRGSHLEKLCLVADGVGKDSISDFTTNLIKRYLCEYTQDFTLKHLVKTQRKRVSVQRVEFSWKTETWAPRSYILPWHEGDYVLLTPRDLLTREKTWINKKDLVADFEDLPTAIPDEVLRAQVNNYFLNALGRRREKEPTKRERGQAAISTIMKFPELIDVFIRLKEDHGDEARDESAAHVEYSETIFERQAQALQALLAGKSTFYDTPGKTHQEALQRLGYLKDVIENKGGHRAFYVKGKPIQREEDIQIMYRLTWFGSPSDVSREVNDGRGPADFKVSRGSRDKTIVEFKLASNSKLRKNLAKQVETYKKASDARHGIKAILYFSDTELHKVQDILRDLRLTGSPDVVLIDAGKDNKPSGSRA